MSNLKVSIEQKKDLVVTLQDFYPPQASSRPAVDIVEFTKLLNLALEQHQKNYGVEDKHTLRLMWYNPDKAIDDPARDYDIVHCKVLSRKFRNMSPVGERRNPKPMHKEDRQHPKYPELVVSVSELPMETEMEFKIMSTDASRLQAHALMFEEFMEAWLWYFRDMGIQDVTFQGRDSDDMEEIKTCDFYTAKLRYLVYSSRIKQIVRPITKAIKIQFDIGPALKVETKNEELGIQERSIDRS